MPRDRVLTNSIIYEMYYFVKIAEKYFYFIIYFILKK